MGIRFTHWPRSPSTERGISADGACSDARRIRAGIDHHSGVASPAPGVRPVSASSSSS
jgi:hypothetical protein